MKRRAVVRSIEQSRVSRHGESYITLFSYFFPEFITAFLLYSLPLVLDAFFIGKLESTSLRGTLGATNGLLHFVIKIAEALSVGTLILSGHNNGKGDLKAVGRTLRDAFWVTAFLGISIASTLYFGAEYIYSWYVPAQMVSVGVPFLKLRAIGILFMFLFLAIVGFLRGIKNVQTPMSIFIVGTIVFIVSDYIFIFGGFGFPALGLQGSALASVVQYATMFFIAIIRIFSAQKYRKYGIQLFLFITKPTEWKRLLLVSSPVVLDKATMAFAYIWLCKMTKTLGVEGVTTFCVMKDMERFSLIPAIALAQVVTFLVSNDMGRQNWDGIRSNIRKIIIMATGMVLSILIIFCWYPTGAFRCFGGQCVSLSLVSRIFPVLSVLAFFDLLQLVLSGALRGAANVRVVMYVRLIVCLGYFIPVSYMISRMTIEDHGIKLLLIYGSYYVGGALMSIIYIWRLHGQRWQKKEAL